jgi:hypothetical protein
MIGVVVEVLASCETRHFTGRSLRPANNFHIRFACYSTCDLRSILPRSTPRVNHYLVLVRDAKIQLYVIIYCILGLPKYVSDFLVLYSMYFNKKTIVISHD